MIYCQLVNAENIINIMIEKGILVTGSHRSGSTWVGQMIALSPSVAYIHEPFNIIYNRPGICSASFKHWFTYICEENENLYYEALKDTLEFKYKILKELAVIKAPKDIVRLFRACILFTMYKLSNKRPLMKDPIAIFSAEWLAKRFNMDVIILIRHPAAFAGSLKKANWTFQFSNFIEQPLLMQHHLSDFRHQIEEFAKKEKDIIDQAILLWNVIHYMILKYKKRNPDWNYVKHETISKNPMVEFGKLYDKLNLTYSKDIHDKIKEYSILKNKNFEDKIKRDSKSNIWSWKKRLTEDEIERIKDKTYDIAKNFYSEEDW